MADYSLEGAHWTAGATIDCYYAGTAPIVFTDQIGNGYPTPDLFPSEIQAAFNDWSSEANIHFQQVTNPAAANIIIGWEDIDGSGGILAFASYSYYLNGLFVSPVYIYFDDLENWDPLSGQESDS